MFQFSEQNRTFSLFNRQRNKPNKDWFNDFLKKIINCQKKKTEVMSMQRAVGFDKPKVDLFFFVIRTTFSTTKIEHREYHQKTLVSVDKSRCTTAHKPRKIVARREKNL